MCDMIYDKKKIINAHNSLHSLGCFAFLLDIICL